MPLSTSQDYFNDFDKDVETKPADLYRKNLPYYIGSILLIALCILSLIIYFNLFSNNKKPNDIISDPIVWTLQQIAKNITDYNNDGLINCIDYTIAFCTYYPNKIEVEIIQNYNPPIMNHLFVKVNGMEIEPQGNHNNYLMWDYWGDLYDPTFNEKSNFYWRYVE